MKVYAKNSFNRFGDDLTELILQYLTFEDKVRLECVSKQWRRLVFNKQFTIELKPNLGRKNSFERVFDDRRQMNEQHLESVLKKCPNIIRVELSLSVNSSVLSLISQYCPNIKSLSHLTYKDSIDLDFGQHYGHKLEELCLYDNYEKIKEFLRFCPNLKKVEIRSISVLLDIDNEFLPKLESIKILKSWKNSEKDVNGMKILSDKYSQTMKTLEVMFEDLTAEQLKTCSDGISRFDNLQSLTLYIEYSEITEPIDDCLSLIGQKCNKLLKLDLDIHQDVQISERLFNVFTHFKVLKKLRIAIRSETVLSLSVKCFKHCKQLNDIEILCPALTEDFFANIASFVPKLQSLRIITEKQFSESFADFFDSMKYIQKVCSLVDESDEIVSVRNWYFGKSLSEMMLSKDGMYVIPVYDDCGLLSYDKESDYNWTDEDE